MPPGAPLAVAQLKTDYNNTEEKWKEIAEFLSNNDIACRAIVNKIRKEPARDLDINSAEYLQRLATETVTELLPELQDQINQQPTMTLVQNIDYVSDPDTKFTFTLNSALNTNSREFDDIKTWQTLNF